MKCPNCEHQESQHGKTGCKACDCYHSPATIIEAWEEIKEREKMQKRKAWQVTYQMGDRGIFQGQVIIVFLHEPTIDDVLQAMFSDSDVPTPHEPMIAKHRARIVERHYQVRETWVWEKPC